MKMNAENPPLLCRAVRTWKSIFGGHDHRAGFGGGHVSRCADCAAYFQREQALTSLLRREAFADVVVSSPSLEQKIKYAVQRSARQERPAAKGFDLIPWAGVLASGALLAFIIAPQIPLQKSLPPKSGSHTVKSLNAPDSQNNLWGYFAPTTALLNQNPLQEEVELVYSDAKSALRFLELNFLPAPTNLVVSRPQDV